ncbi:MAG: Crp/Fnr family transcriptional regulator [Chitinophagaceae bacterium]|uniref:Crp/Fnr family transcriptional regulator n=1 Tax=unclassified Paraflavitalea TaxID=2798305 RepID=UPI003D3432E1|nr:Crp/Fnr family transcriptional regulator [Chitinophagaceae bacterium]
MNVEKNQTSSVEIAGAFSAMVNAIYPVSKEALDYVTKRMSPVYIQKGSLLVSSGQHCDHLYFVVKGVLRGYVQQGTKEITTWITAENELVTSISSFYQKVPSIENIEALEDCTLATIHRDDLNYMYTAFPEVNAFVRIVLEKYYQDAEERAYIARLTEATGKYHRFINTKSHLLNRIPLKFIASYLGMTLETLSRIRSKITYSR